MAVSLIQSVYGSFGSGVVAPGTGVVLQNRAAGFSRGAGPPERARARDSARSTRSSRGCSSSDGGLLGPFGVMGGAMQPQGHFQVVRRVVDDGDDPQAALDAPRWRVEDDGVVELEPGLGAPRCRSFGRSATMPGSARSPHGFGVGPDDPPARDLADRRLGRPRRRLRRRPLAAPGSGGQSRESRRRPRYSAAAVTIRVLIVDDHAVVRTGLRLLLDREDDIEVVGEAGDGDDGIRAARLEKPDVVLLDVVMPGRTGIEACAEVVAASQGRVLMLSMQDDPSYVREAFGAGASGYMLKEAADTELVQAVREVAAGGRYVHPTLGARLAQAEVEAARRAASDPLSDREREVLRLLALGHTNQEIAKRLFISVRTAETHRAHIMQKLGLGTRAELVRYALVNGLLDES